MPVIAYPDHLPTFLKAGKTRRQAAPFSVEEARRGHAYFKATGPDTPVYWDVTFMFNRFQAIQFWLWFTLKLRRGVNEFTMPIDTEGGLSVHRCRFMPNSLLPAQEYGGAWTYTATIESRVVEQGEPSESPAVPRTIAHVNFDAYPAVYFVSSNQLDSGPSDEFQVLTSGAISDSTGYAQMRSPSGSPASTQTESDTLNTLANGFQVLERIGLDAVTFEMFAKVDAGGSGNWNLFLQSAVVNSVGDSPDFYFEAGEFSGNDYIESYYYDSEGTYSPNQSSLDRIAFVFPRDQWTHIAIVMDGLDFRCYIDGDLVRSATAASGPASGLREYSFQYLWIGAGYAGSSPNVYIDCARACAGALYTGSSFTPPTARFPYPL